jgi:hypothetical protein
MVDVSVHWEFKSLALLIRVAHRTDSIRSIEYASILRETI